MGHTIENESLRASRQLGEAAVRSPDRARIALVSPLQHRLPQPRQPWSSAPMKATSLSALALVLLSSTTALAENPPDGPMAPLDGIPRINIGASVGNNSPAGLVGVEADYRIHRYFSA